LLGIVIGQGWEGHVTRVGKVKRTRILLQGPMVRTFEKLKCKRKNGMEINIGEEVCEDGQVGSAVYNAV